LRSDVVGHGDSLDREPDPLELRGGDLLRAGLVADRARLRDEPLEEAERPLGKPNDCGVQISRRRRHRR
jgi:hypothetical protein